MACSAGLTAATSGGEEAPKPAAAILEAKEAIDQIEASLAADKPKRAASEFKAAADAMEALLALPRPPAGVRPLQDRLRKIRENLELEGIDVSSLVVPVVKSKAATSPKQASRSMDDQPAFARPAGSDVTAVNGNRVSFASDVVPVLLQQCTGCHGGGRPKGGLDMGSYAAIVRGGESGSPIVPGKGADSLLVRKLVGTRIEGQRMPLGRPPLQEDVIDTIRRWIDEGASIDLLPANTPLENLAAAGRAAKLSHEALRDLRFAAAGKFWNRAIPDERGITVQRDDVLVVGNLTEAEMEEVADRARKIAKKLHDDYGLGGGEHLSKGGCILFVCRKGYDYSSFWQTIIGREKPGGFVCHAGLVGDVLHGACVVPKEGLDAEDELAAEIAEQLATAAWLSRNAPEWFAVGAGKVAAARIAPKAANVVAASKPGAAPAAPPEASVFFGPDIDPGERVAVASRFVGDLAGRGKLASLVTAMKRLGTASDGFSRAFAGVFGGSPDATYGAWAAGGGSGRR